MKYTICGFQQSRLVELGLDTTDAVILNWFIDFRDTKGMESIVIDRKPAYWVDYGHAVRQLPVAAPPTYRDKDGNVQETAFESRKKRIKRRFGKLVDAGVLIRHRKQSGQLKDFKFTYTGEREFYEIGPEYDGLIYYEEATEETPGRKCPDPGTQKSGPRDANVPPYDPHQDSSHQDGGEAPRYSEEDLKREFGPITASDYLNRVRLDGDGKGRTYANPAAMAKKWALEDGLQIIDSGVGTKPPSVSKDVQLWQYRLKWARSEGFFDEMKAAARQALNDADYTEAHRLHMQADLSNLRDDQWEKVKAVKIEQGAA